MARRPADPTPPAETAAPEIRAVRVKRGDQPTPTAVSGFQRWAWKTFGARVIAKGVDPALEDNLVKAHMRIRADEYVANTLATTVIAAAVSLAVGIGAGVLFILKHDVIIGLLIGVLAPILGTVGAYFGLLGTPGSKAKERGRKIDRKISPAMSFVSAMSSADVNVDQIFKELGRQKIYGEVAEEAAWITRDTELLGVTS